MYIIVLCVLTIVFDAQASLKNQKMVFLVAVKERILVSDSKDSKHLGTVFLLLTEVNEVGIP